MTLLQYVRDLYSLDTLDARFTTSSKAPARAQIDSVKPAPQEDGSATKWERGTATAVQQNAASPSLWRTTEFFIYYGVIIVAVPLMFKAVYDVSNSSHPNYSKFADLLQPGWIPGRMFDNTDGQYSTIRENVPYMFILVALHPLLRKLVETVYSFKSQTQSSVARTNSSGHGLPQALADARLNRRATFDVYFGLFFLSLLNGLSVFKILLILYFNFAIATRLPKAYVQPATWGFNICILFANELCDGYPYAALARLIMPWPASEADGKGSINSWGSVLDSYGGLMPRWQILFNITVLRLISFNLDYRWSQDRGSSSPLEKKQLDPADLSERDRVNIPARHGDYSFRNYLAYTLYAPLYIGGPIITFNDYVSQVRYPAKSISVRRTILYGMRFLTCLLTMETMLHFIYAVAISKAQPAWEVYTPFQLSMLGYFNLHIIWLKLLLPWRFFRLWSLLDGIDPPENMVRCMSDNYSTLAFWRGWHRSFNRWLVRYIYIPLGGSSRPGSGAWGSVRSILNFLVIFTFVALWHDINLKLLMWGWLVTLFVLPEMIAGFLFPAKKWQNSKTAYRYICGIGAVGNILMMMAANLVGFAVGLDGLQGLVHGIVGSYYGLVFLAAACGALFVGAQVMFEIRQHELRHGIKMKC